MKNNRIAGVVIAAGGSTRLGVPKQLLSWQGTTLIEHVIQIASECGISPIQVVLGAYHQLILEKIKHYQVNVVINRQWKMGKGGSISLGIGSLPDYVDASFIFVSDQPYLNKQIINEIISIYQKDEVQIIAPYIEGIQTNPVLFDRIVFNDLKTLTGEQGGKEIINRFQIVRLDWKEKDLLVDIDHPTDLEKLNP